jgi:hypothetical protein
VARTLAETYRRFDASPLYQRVALAISESTDALRAIEAALPRKRSPALILAALHDLVLDGRAPALDVDALVRLGDEVAAIAARRRLRANEAGPHAVLHPAIAEVACRAGADAVGLIDVGCSAALNLNVDRVAITYSDGRSLGDPAAPVQVSATLVEGSLPARRLPEVVARIGLDPDPVDVADPAEARWLRACLPPDLPHERLEAEIALAAADPPKLLRGDPVDLLPEAFALIPANAVPVVLTTWSLSRATLEHRLRFLQRLDAKRMVAWVSVEGVGVAPAIPRLGDRPAFGHSTIGLAVFDRSSLHAEAVGRCWSRGRLLSWPAQAADGGAA